MKPVTDINEIRRYRELVREMVTLDREYDLSPAWVRSREWKVIPAESGVRLPKEEIPKIVRALSAFGCTECVAIVTEPSCLQPPVPGSENLGDMPTTYAVAVTEEDFRNLNRELGPFRFLLTDQNRSWAISCNESYNLFAGPLPLVEAMLGMSSAEAEREFREFASLLSQGDPAYTLLAIAKEYAS